MSFSLKKILLVKMLEGLEKCINGYKKNQSNDFDETLKKLIQIKKQKIMEKNVVI